MTTDYIEITQPDDWHLHLRDGEMMAGVLPFTARQFTRAIVMPNLATPVTTTQLAEDYRERILEALPANLQFEPLMTLYLTDNTSADEINRAQESGVITAVKYYPAGATTNSDNGVTDLSKCYPALEAMQTHGMPLLMHGEVTDNNIDIFDREKYFIHDVLMSLMNQFPDLKIVLEHISTADAVDFIFSASDNIAATITPQHLMFDRNAIFKGGLQPHYYCLPILKRNIHRQALLKAIASGSRKFFLGTDSAPHAQSQKEKACGCAGIFSAHAAIEMYASVFEQQNVLNNLEAFASFNGPDFYSLPRNTNKVRLNKTKWQVPDSYPVADNQVIPLLAGDTLEWKLADD